MPDISNEIAAIQVATTGSEIRSAIIEALTVINDAVPSSYYSGSYTISPGSSSIILQTSNKGMYGDLIIEAFPVYSGSYIINPSTVSQTFSVSNMMMTSDILVNPMPVYEGPYNIIRAFQYVDTIVLSVGSKYASTNVEVALIHRPCFNVTDAVFDSFDLSSSWESYLSNAYVQTFSLNSTSYSAYIDLTVIPTESQLSYLKSAGVETFIVQKNNASASLGFYDFMIVGSSISTSMLSSDMTLQCLVSYASALSSIFI